MTQTVQGFAAYCLRLGLAPTSIRWLKNETEYWIKKEKDAGFAEWQLVEIEIALK